MEEYNMDEMIDKTAERMIVEAIIFDREGKLDEAIDLFEQVRERFYPVSYTPRRLDALESYTRLNQGNIDEAIELANNALDLIRVPDFANSIALGVLALVNASQDEPLAINLSSLSVEMLPDGEKTLDSASRINKYGVAIAKFGNFNATEAILREARQISERFELSKTPEVAKRAQYQVARSYHNFALLVLIPQEKSQEAKDILAKQVIPKYRAIGAISDMAIALEQVGLIYEKARHNLHAFSWYEQSLNAWIEVGNEIQIQQLQEKVRKALKSLSEKEERRKTEGPFEDPRYPGVLAIEG